MGDEPRRPGMQTTGGRCGAQGRGARALRVRAQIRDVEVKACFGESEPSKMTATSLTMRRGRICAGTAEAASTLTSAALPSERETRTTWAE